MFQFFFFENYCNEKRLFKKKKKATNYNDNFHNCKDTILVINIVNRFLKTSINYVVFHYVEYSYW